MFPCYKKGSGYTIYKYYHDNGKKGNGKKGKNKNKIYSSFFLNLYNALYFS